MTLPFRDSVVADRGNLPNSDTQTEGHLCYFGTRIRSLENKDSTVEVEVWGREGLRRRRPRTRGRQRRRRHAVDGPSTSTRPRLPPHVDGYRPRPLPDGSTQSDAVRGVGSTRPVQGTSRRPSSSSKETLSQNRRGRGRWGGSGVRRSSIGTGKVLLSKGGAERRGMVDRDLSSTAALLGLLTPATHHCPFAKFCPVLPVRLPHCLFRV